MQRMSKTELQQELAALGETAPSKWTKMELRSRINELRLESGLQEMGAQTKTPLQQKLQELNKASRKKETLIQHVETEMKLGLSGHESAHQIQGKAIRYLYKTVPAAAGDYVGFGKHADLQYMDMLDYPRYTDWLLKTHEEDPEADHRLHRLAGWVLANKDKPRSAAASSAAAGSSSLRNNKKEKEGEDPTSAVPKEMIQGLLETIEALKSEVSELKGERPRKARDQTEDKDL